MKRIKKITILQLILIGIILILLLCVFLKFASNSNPVKAEINNYNENDCEFIDNSVIVELNESYVNLGKSLNETYFKDIQVDNVEVLFNSSNCCIIKLELLNNDKENVLRTIDILNRHNAVKQATPNYIGEFGGTANDYYFSSQWGLSCEFGINIDPAWDISEGSYNVRVGVVDSGVYEHLDLKANLVSGWNFVDNNSNTEDRHGHGTHVAGIIGAVGDNNIGISGINKKVQIVPLKISHTSTWETSKVIAAINYAENLWGSADQIDILNFSGWNFSNNSALKSAIDNYSGLFVCIAGNGATNIDTNPNYPGSFKINNLITVGATDNKGAIGSFSNYGEKSVDIYAPGVDIYSTYLNNIYIRMSGTSMAAPHVAGVAALLLSVDPNLSARAIKNLILEGASTITITPPDNTTQTVKMLDAYNPLKILEENKNKRYRVRFDKCHYIEVTPKLIHEQDFTYSQTYSVTAPETMTYTDSNDHRDIRIFTAWRMNLNGTDGYDKDKNPWIQLSTDRTFNLNLSDIVNAYYPYFNENDTIYIRAAFSENVSIPPSQSCIAEGSLITLADGSQKAVQELTGNEMLLVWNMFTGTFDTAPILCIDSDPADWYEVIKLYFSDGTQVDVISEHGFWDFDLNEYVYLDNNAEDYIGHWFNKQTSDSGGTGWTKAQLTDVAITQEYTTAWSPVTYGYLCYYVNGMLTMPGGIAGLFNIFEVDSENMRYDEDLFYRDIEIYGTYTYEEFAGLLPVTEELFNAVNGQYLKVAIGKGLIDIQTLSEYTERYSGLFA